MPTYSYSGNSYIDKKINDIIEPEHINDLQDEVEIVESAIMMSPYNLVEEDTCGLRATMDETITFGLPVYITPAGELGYADAETISTAKVIGIGAGSKIILLDGFIKNIAWSFTPGEYIFLASGGGLTQTKPTETDECVVILGVALTSTIIRFKPELVIVELL